MDKSYIDMFSKIKLLQKNLKRFIKNKDDNRLKQLFQDLTKEINVLRTCLEELDSKNIILKQYSTWLT